MMQLLKDYKKLEEEIFTYFGYVEDWVKIPISDNTDVYWKLDGEGPGTVTFAESIEEMEDEGGRNYYQWDIYTQRFLPKWVYRGAEYTMIAVATGCDGNKYLAIFDNSKEIR